MNLLEETSTLRLIDYAAKTDLKNTASIDKSNLELKLKLAKLKLK